MATRIPTAADEAVRQGIKRDGKSVAAMPSASFATMSDEQLGQIFASVREQVAFRLMPFQLEELRPIITPGAVAILETVDLVIHILAIRR